MRTRDVASLLSLAAGAATCHRVDEGGVVNYGEELPAGMAFEAYMRLQPGMTGGEVLRRAGPPDHGTVEDARTVAKALYDHPTRASPVLTVVAIRGGRAANLERNRKTD